jgi:Flp pilus assembly protein TadB
MVSPDYIGLLFKDPIGIVLLISAVCLMFAGVVVMKRMIKIRI